MLSPKCSPRAKQCPRLSCHPSFNVGGNILDFSGVGVTAVPEVPRGRILSPFSFHCNTLSSSRKTSLRGIPAAEEANTRCGTVSSLKRGPLRCQSLSEAAARPLGESGGHSLETGTECSSETIPQLTGSTGSPQNGVRP